MKNKECIMSVNFDVENSNRYGTGKVCLTESNLLVYIKRRVIFSFQLDKITKIYIDNGVGCAYLVCDAGGKKTRIACFSQSRYDDFIAFVNAFNAYREDFAGSGFTFRCGEKRDKHTGHLRRMFMIAFKSGRLSLAVIFLQFALIASMIAAPIIQKVLIDNFIIPSSKNWFGILWITVAFIFCGIINYVSILLRKRATANISQNVQRTLNKKLMSSYQSVLLTNFGENKNQVVFSQARGDLDVLDGYISKDIMEFISAVLIMLSSLVFLYLINWLLALYVLIPLPFICLIYLWYYLKCNKRYTLQNHMINNMDKRLKIFCSEIFDIKMYNYQWKEGAKLLTECDQYYKYSMQNEKIFSRGFHLITLAFCAVEILMIFFGASYILAERLSIGEYLMIVAFVAFFYANIDTVLAFRTKRNRALVASHRIFTVLHDGKLSEPTQTKCFENSIEFKDVCAKLSKNAISIDNINFKINKGEVVAICGYSGMGKSVITKLMFGITRPNSGVISVDGENVLTKDPQVLFDNVRFLTSHPLILNDSFLNNITLGSETNLADVVSVCKQIGLHDIILKYDNAYNAVIDEENCALKYYQLIMLARCMINKLPLLILNKAFSGLSKEERDRLYDYVLQDKSNRITIVVTNNLEKLKEVDKIIFVDKTTVSVGNLALLKTNQRFLNLINA